THPALEDAPMRASQKSIPMPSPEQANRPSGVTAIQQAAVCVVGADRVTGSRLSSSSTYDVAALAPGAPPNASETIRVSSVKAKTNGVLPTEGWQVSGPARPSSSTGNTSTQLVAFSVTTSASPSGANDPCAGPAAGALNGRVTPSGRSPPCRPISKPARPSA